MVSNHRNANEVKKIYIFSIKPFNTLLFNNFIQKTPIITVFNDLSNKIWYYIFHLPKLHQRFLSKLVAIFDKKKQNDKKA